jgi:hypothetical protein
VLLVFLGLGGELLGQEGAMQVGKRSARWHFEEQGKLTNARAHESGESRSPERPSAISRARVEKRKRSEPKLIGDGADTGVDLFEADDWR